MKTYISNQQAKGVSLVIELDDGTRQEIYPTSVGNLATIRDVIDEWLTVTEQQNIPIIAHISRKDGVTNYVSENEREFKSLADMKAQIWAMNSRDKCGGLNHKHFIVRYRYKQENE